MLNNILSIFRRKYAVGRDKLQEKKLLFIDDNEQTHRKKRDSIRPHC